MGTKAKSTKGKKVKATTIKHTTTTARKPKDGDFDSLSEEGLAP